MYKVRVQYEKGEAVRYIGHLDLLHAFIRAMRRSGLQLTYSQGFNPRPVTNFAMPLSLGTTGLMEYGDIEFDEEYQLEEITARLNACLPSGLAVSKTGLRGASFLEIEAADYTVSLQTDFPSQLLHAAQDFFQQESIVVLKKSKKKQREVDIKPMVLAYHFAEEKMCVSLYLKLCAGAEKNLNPELLLRALREHCPSLPLNSYHIHRTELYLKDGQSFFA